MSIIVLGLIVAVIVLWYEGTQINRRVQLLEMERDMRKEIARDDDNEHKGIHGELLDDRDDDDELEMDNDSHQHPQAKPYTGGE